MPTSSRVLARHAWRAVATLVSVLLLAAVARATIGASLQMQLGNPSSATSEPSNHAHYLIQRDQYALDYNDATHEPNWVSWDLTTADIGSSGRASFIQDTTLPVGFYQVLTTDYSGSGYDRGHMCPSADRTITVADNQQVFYMSNMVPQAPDNNQGVWANFESYCRSLASAGNEVLITCGPSGFGGSTIASGVAIPGYTWKFAVVVPLGDGLALSRITSSTRVIAIKVPNVAGVRSTPWQNFVTSVAQIEADTGYTFFTALPASIASALRIEVDGQSAVGAPSIVAQPVSQTTVVGGSANFSVTATGDEPLGYQWLKDDVEIPGATDATLSLVNVGAADVGKYDVVVTNPVGSVTSNAASLIVSGLPPVVTTSPASQTVNAGSTVTFAVTVSGSPTLTYQWRKNGAPIALATNTALTLSNVQSGDAADYDVVVTNSVSSTTSAPATLVVNPAAPTILTSPTAQTATTGGSASFSVVAVGTSPLSYQWRKAGVPLSNGGSVTGATTATLSLTNVAAVDAANYDVIVTNGLGSATSASAALAVTAPLPSTVYWNFGTTVATADPASGLSADISGGTLSQGNNNGTTVLVTNSSTSSGYTGSSGSFNAGAAARIGALNKAAGGSAYFEFTLTPTDGKRLSASGLSFGSRSTATGPQAYAVFSSLDSFANPVAAGALGADSVWRLQTPSFTTVTGATGMSVTFRIYGYNGTGSPAAGTANWRIDDLKLTVSAVFPPPTAPIVVSTTPTDGATNVDVAAPIVVSFNEAVSFTGSWFTITSAADGPVAATVTGGPMTFSLTPPANFSYSDTITVSIAGAQVVDQATGTIHGTTNTAFTFHTGVYVPPTPPSVTTQPNSQTVTSGSIASFTVAASGTAPLTYKWRKNGSPVGGNASAATPTLTLTSVTTADAGDYDCIVSNVAGSDVSHVATLNVTIVPPSITAQPAAQLTTFGGNVSFSAAATGTAPLSYQWRRNGAPLANGGNVSGATSTTLVVSGATLAEAGTYDVVVTNAASSIASNGAVLAIVDAPSLTYWDFAAAVPTSGVPANVSGGQVAQGNNNGTTTLLTTTSASGSYTGASGGNNAGAAARVGAFNPAAGGSAYFEFTFTPTSERQFAASAISFGMRSTGTGPQAFALYSSVDNFSAPLAVGAVPADSAWHLYTPTFRGVVGAVGAPVTFRLFGYNGAGSPSTGTANWRIDDVKLTAGVVVVAPTIVTAPASQTATVGDTLTLSVGATGTAPFTYQWRKAGQPLAGETSATLMLTDIRTSAAGDYDVVVTNVVGSAVSSPAAVNVNKAPAAVTLDALNLTYSGLPQPVVVNTAPASLSVNITYNGSAAVPVNVGSYAVAATIDDPNYFGSAAGTLVISPAAASISFGNLVATYDGTARSVTATTSPPSLPVSITYNGSPSAPIDAGSYAVAATIADANYVGDATATLVVNKAIAGIGLGNLQQTYDGAPKPISVSTSPTGLTVDVTYDGAVAPPTAAGTYSVLATINSRNYSGSASGALVIDKATATVALSNLTQRYDGSPRSVTVTTSPDHLTVNVTYAGSTDAPINPGTYHVVATIDDANYRGSAIGELVIGITALVRHAPSLYGGVVGSLQVLLPENVTLNSSTFVSGDLLVPGTPAVVLAGRPVYGSTIDSAGDASPSNYTVTLNSAALQHVVRRVNAIALPVVAPPPAPTGTRDVTLSAGQTLGDVSTLRNVTLNSRVGQVYVAPGTYGSFTANSGSGFTLGVPGATEPAVYYLQSLTLNRDSQVLVVGPVVLTLASGAVVNTASVGNTQHPTWLTINVAAGGVTCNGTVQFAGSITAPNGTVTLSGGTVMSGDVAADRLTVNSNGELNTAQ